MTRQDSLDIRGILLDLDETLYSRQEGFSTWLESEARERDAFDKLDRARVAELDQRGRGDKDALLEYLDAVFDWRESQPERLQRFRTGLTKAIRLPPDVRELLLRLGQEFRLGLVTNGTAATQRAKLQALGVERLFDPVVISEEVGFRKPDARIFELAIANWAIPSASVLFVGDDLICDIQGAKAAGMRALQVGAEPGISSISELEGWLRESIT